MKKNRKTTIGGKIFLAGVAFIVAAGVLYGVSEYTESPTKGRAQEHWSIALFAIGVIGMLAGPQIGQIKD